MHKYIHIAHKISLKVLLVNENILGLTNDERKHLTLPYRPLKITTGCSPKGHPEAVDIKLVLEIRNGTVKLEDPVYNFDQIASDTIFYYFTKEQNVPYTKDPKETSSEHYENIIKDESKTLEALAGLDYLSMSEEKIKSTLVNFATSSLKNYYDIINLIVRLPENREEAQKLGYKSTTLAKGIPIAKKLAILERYKFDPHVFGITSY